MTALGPGVRVKCVRQADSSGGDDGKALPIRFMAINSIWTVSEVWRKGEFSGIYILHEDYLKLVEWPTNDLLFSSSLFVPLDGNEDISVFTTILSELPAENPILVPVS